MSLADRIPSDRRGIDGQRVFNILWLAGLSFAGAVIALLLLQRLGMPMPLVLGITAVWFVTSILILSWIGRTMTSSLFFFAGRMGGAAAVGLGGTTDWISGAFLMLFFSGSLTAKLILAPALMLGLLLQTALFATAFQRSGVSTLTGFVAWRSQAQSAGLIALLVVATMLGLLIYAEFSVARDMFSRIAQVGPQTATWFVLILAALPALFGGWLALLVVNAVLAIWMLICVLAPAIMTGFFPTILRAGLELDRDGRTLQLLEATGGQVLDPDKMSAPLLLATVVVLSTGFAVLPHALSRLSLNARPVAAIESLGWSALAIFLVLSAMPLSIGLIGVSPTSSKLALMLETQAVLFMLPYAALLFAAFNALSATLFALSSALVRAFRRSRNGDPGEQSVFWIRLLTIVLVAALGTVPTGLIPSSGHLLVIALALGAGGLFLPLVFSIWFSGIPRTAVVLAMVAGSATVGISIFEPALLGFAHPVLSGAAGMAASGFLILCGRVFGLIRKPRMPDLRLQQLRQPDILS